MDTLSLKGSSSEWVSFEDLPSECSLQEVVGSYWDRIVDKMPPDHRLYLFHLLRNINVRKIEGVRRIRIKAKNEDELDAIVQSDPALSGRDYTVAYEYTSFDDGRGGFAIEFRVPKYVLVDRQGKEVFQEILSIRLFQFLRNGAHTFVESGLWGNKEPKNKFIKKLKKIKSGLSDAHRIIQVILGNTDAKDWSGNIKNEIYTCIDTVTIDLLTFLNYQEELKEEVVMLTPIGFASHEELRTKYVEEGEYAHYGLAFFTKHSHKGVQSLRLNIMNAGIWNANIESLDQLTSRKAAADVWGMYLNLRAELLPKIDDMDDPLERKLFLDAINEFREALQDVIQFINRKKRMDRNLSESSHNGSISHLEQ